MEVKNMTTTAYSLLVEHGNVILDLCQDASSCTHHCSCITNANDDTVKNANTIIIL